jgi:hypothetical protein
VSETRLEMLGPDTLDAFLASPVAVLVLTKRDCAACASWSEVLEGFLAEDERWKGVRFGKLILDQPGLGTFKKASPWLREVTDLPYNVLYKDGQLAATFLGAGLPRLVARLERLTGEAAQ